MTKIPENEIMVAWEMTGTQQGRDNHIRVSQLWDLGGFSPHEDKQKAKDINASWYYGYYLTPLPLVCGVSHKPWTAKLQEILQAIHKKSIASLKHADSFDS